MILISNLTLNIKDGSTIASTNIYGTDKKTYINIGSGNVFKLYWETPTLTNDTVDHYNLVIKRHDITLNVYYDIFDKNIGLVNNFYVDSPLLPSLPEQYMMSIYLVAHGKQGSVTTSNVINPYISKGTGTYVKVQPEGYAQPIMKRALAFAKVAFNSFVTLRDAAGNTLKDTSGKVLFTLTYSDALVLEDSDGQILADDDDKTLYTSTATLADSRNQILEDANGKTLFAKASRILESTNGWAVMREGYTKDTNGNWRTNDIKYEVLVDEDGSIITDSNNEPIYIL